MQNKNQNVGVIIGRFQPFHNGHVNMIKTSFNHVDDIFLFIGSSNKHSSIKNPFSAPERKQMITQWFEKEYKPNHPNKKLHILFSEDYLYSDWKWKSRIVKKLEDEMESLGFDKDSFNGKNNITLFGHDKDSSSYYLKFFVEWGFVEIENFKGINATEIRNTFFESGVVSKYVMPETSFEILHKFKKTIKYSDLVDEFKFYKDEKEKFKHYPYPETLKFTCSDAVVICYGHILLIKRKHAPGKNTWALPGGFVNNKETFVDACIRELKEETNLRVPEKVIRGNVKSFDMFDSPDRTVGIPRVSMAYYIDLQLGNDGSFPEVRSSSDACDAQWVSLSKLDSLPLFDDHRDIIEHFI